MTPRGPEGVRPSPGLRLVVAVVPRRGRGTAMARELVERRLAACVNVVPIESVYRWKGRVESAREYALWAKTTDRAVDDLVRWILLRHPYEVPDVHELVIARPHPPYRRWVAESVVPQGPSRSRRRAGRRSPGARAPRRTRGRRRPR